MNEIRRAPRVLLQKKMEAAQALHRYDLHGVTCSDIS
jgi:hypothetical protein